MGFIVAVFLLFVMSFAACAALPAVRFAPGMPCFDPGQRPWAPGRQEVSGIAGWPIAGKRMGITDITLLQAWESGLDAPVRVAYSASPVFFCLVV